MSNVSRITITKTRLRIKNIDQNYQTLLKLLVNNYQNFERK